MRDMTSENHRLRLVMSAHVHPPPAPAALPSWWVRWRWFLAIEAGLLAVLGALAWLVVR